MYSQDVLQTDISCGAHKGFSIWSLCSRCLRYNIEACACLSLYAMSYIFWNPNCFSSFPGWLAIPKYFWFFVYALWRIQALLIQRCTKNCLISHKCTICRKCPVASCTIFKNCKMHIAIFACFSKETITKSLGFRTSNCTEIPQHLRQLSSTI